MHTLRESPLEQRARLSKTPQGKALLELLAKYPTKRALAKAIGSSDEYVTRCSRMGKISMAGAILINKLGVMKKEQLRPDVDDWSVGQPGLPIGTKAARSGAHQALLRDLAISFGSVKSFCRAAGFSIRNYHDWLSRDKISNQGLTKILCISELSDSLRYRVEMESIDRRHVDPVDDGA